ncbi:right-handed parallel beta-helix repeat-containing protein [Deinococcus aestuarii]|uniref:right-handed parallel beta-helix repeat-containing protein n=1 Tax=Deinococcus aestuarii TaxID=2774531 RepID=UPI001C0C06AB|nr:right-handed parallel beta-helix repeat-containing protein [Deinococcus aestuarii]
MQLEAERATTVSLPAGEVQALTVVDPGAPSGGHVVSDAAASGGQAVELLSNGNSVRFSVPAGLAAGSFTVRVQGRGDLYQGNPIVSLRVNGTEKGRVELNQATYSAFTVGNFDLKSGDTLDVIFVNDAYGGGLNDRNAIIDYLIIDPTGTTTAAPTPPTTPSTPSPTPVAIPGNAVDVKSFGARGDGQTDDTEALRRAAESGKSLFFPSGTYRVRRVISFKGLNGQTISGQNATLQTDGSFIRDGDNAVLFIKNSTGVTVQGLKIIGNRTNSTSPSVDIEGVRVANSTNVTLRALGVTRAPTNGISVFDSSGTVIENSSVSDSTRHGIWVYRSQNTRLSGNTITGNGQPNSNTVGGIGILATAGNGFTAENNVIRNMSDDGTKTEAVNNVVYRGNTVDVFGRDGIKVMPHTPSGVTEVRDVVIENNTISGFRAWVPYSSSNILVHSTLGGRVSGNTVNGSGGTADDEDGIRINAYGSYTRSRDIEVRDNTVRNVKTGVQLTSDNITVSGNRIQANGYAVLLQGVGLNLTNNPELRGGAGITVLYNYGAQADMTGNSLFGNDLAIYAANSGNRGRIAGNVFASTYRKQVAAGSGVSYTP